VSRYGSGGTWYPGQKVTFRRCGHVQHFPPGGGPIRPRMWINASAGTLPVGCQAQCQVAAVEDCPPGCPACLLPPGNGWRNPPQGETR
jgi:hypothetical protein